MCEDLFGVFGDIGPMVVERIVATWHGSGDSIASYKFVEASVVSQVAHNQLEPRRRVIHVDVPVANSAVDFDLSVDGFS